jgi:hypothetical protein
MPCLSIHAIIARHLLPTFAAGWHDTARDVSILSKV